MDAGMMIARHVEAAMNKPFEWGDLDCVTWAANVAGEGTETDLMGDWRGAYSSKDEAREEIRARGFATLSRAIRARLAELGWQRVPANIADNFALGLMRVRGAGFVLAVRWKGMWMVRLVDGVAHIESEHIKAAWQCPR